MEVIWGSGGIRLSIDIDERLLAHVEPDHLVDALPGGCRHFLQDFLVTRLTWLPGSVDWEPVNLEKAKVVYFSILEEF